MKLWPLRVLGGSSPVHAIFRHSITVWQGKERKGKETKRKERKRKGSNIRKGRILQGGWEQP